MGQYAEGVVIWSVNIRIYVIVWWVSKKSLWSEELIYKKIW
jgi:hypothetical protein